MSNKPFSNKKINSEKKLQPWCKAEIEKQKQDATASLDAEVDSLSRQVLEKLLGNLVKS